MVNHFRHADTLVHGCFHTVELDEGGSLTAKKAPITHYIKLIFLHLKEHIFSVLFQQGKCHENQLEKSLFSRFQSQRLMTLNVNEICIDVSLFGYFLQ